jgi:hypothetical protein
MLLLTSTSDLVRLTTGSSGDIEVHADWVDYTAPNTFVPDNTNTASITGTGTTTVVAAPASTVSRNVKNLSIFNNHASVSNLLTVDHTDGTNAEVLWKGTLLAGQSVVFDAIGGWTVYNANGIKQTSAGAVVTRVSSAPAQGLTSAEAYITNSGIAVPGGTMIAGMRFKWWIHIVKTGAATAAPVWKLYVGTNGSTADTARFVTGTTVWTVAAPAQTAVVDKCVFECEAEIVAAGASGSIFARYSLPHTLTTTGFAAHATQTQYGVTGAIDISAANLILGISATPGASSVWTVDKVYTEAIAP